MCQLYIWAHCAKSVADTQARLIGIDTLCLMCRLNNWAQCVESTAGKQARLVSMDSGIPGVLVCGH